MSRLRFATYNAVRPPCSSNTCRGLTQLRWVLLPSTLTGSTREPMREGMINRGEEQVSHVLYRGPSAAVKIVFSQKENYVSISFS